MAKRDPRARIAEKVTPLVVELGKLGFDVEVKLNTENAGEVKWKKKPQES